MSFALLRSSVAGLAGGLAWYVGLRVIFGSVQGILGNPSLQSQKMIAAFIDTRSSENPNIVLIGLLLIGLLLIGLIWGFVYSSIVRA
jgi:RsiW-degrading membrane proteinase PrsW (M82 family)